MANYLKGRNRLYYDRHSSRAYSRTATPGERSYSKAWLKGFSAVWHNDGIADINQCKSSFERTAFKRGSNFARKVIDE